MITELPSADLIRPPVELPKDSQGGIVPTNLESARKVDLVTFPEKIDGANCGNCEFIDKGFCIHPQVRQAVNERECCSLWNAPGTLRAWEKFHSFDRFVQEQVKSLENHQPTVAIDWGGTIADVSSHRNDPSSAEIREGAAEAIQQIKQHGWKVIIFSTHDKDEIGDWLDEHDVPYDYINENPDNPSHSGKIIADLYVDDLAVNAQKPWPEILSTVLASKPKHSERSHLILTGYSGSGKSTLSKALSETIGLPVYKVDKDPLWKENQELTDHPSRFERGSKEWHQFRKLLKKLIRRALSLKEPHILEGCQFLAATGTLRGHNVILVDGDEDTIVRQRLKRDAEEGKLERDGREERERKARDLYAKLRPDVERLKGRPGVEVITPQTMGDWMKNYVKKVKGKTHSSNGFKDLSWLDSNLGGALVKPPATSLPPSSLFRNRLALEPEKVKELRGKYKGRDSFWKPGYTFQNWLSEYQSAARNGGMAVYDPYVTTSEIKADLRWNFNNGMPAEEVAALYNMGEPLRLRPPGWASKGIGSTIESAGRWLASRWESLEQRYGRRAALGMAVAAVSTFPIPGNIAAIIAAAEAIRGIHGYFSQGLYGNFVEMNGTKALKPPSTGESYFSSCERDDKGHCLPKGKGGSEGEKTKKKIRVYEEVEPEELPWSGNMDVPSDWRELTSEGGRLGKVKVVDIDNVKPTEESSQSDIDSLKEYISDVENDLPPIIVEQDEDGLFVVDGNTRYAAAKQLGYKKIAIRLIRFEGEESPFLEKSLNGYESKDIGSARGKPCKQGQAASRTGCIPAKKPKPGEKKPERKPREEETEARQAWTERDSESLRKVAEKVKLAGTKRGGLGVAGLQSIAKLVGFVGASKFKKAGLAQALYDHLSAAAKRDPVSDATDRLDRIQLAEKGTGTSFKDRIVSGIIATDPKIYQEDKYKRAIADVGENGDNAKAENISYLKAIRRKVLSDLKESSVDRNRVAETLRELAESGYGSLKPEELTDYLEGLMVARAEQKAKKETAGVIVPDNLRLAPSPKERKRTPRRERPEEYVDRLRIPLSSRLEQIENREKQSKMPFGSLVLNQLIGDPRIGESDLPGKGSYQEASSRLGQGIRLSGDAENKMRGFRKRALASLKRGKFQPEYVADALERLDGDGYGTLKINEFQNILKKIDPELHNL